MHSDGVWLDIPWCFLLELVIDDGWENEWEKKWSESPLIQNASKTVHFIITYVLDMPQLKTRTLQ
jgi:hypothetical protein